MSLECLKAHFNLQICIIFQKYLFFHNGLIGLLMIPLITLCLYDIFFNNTTVNLNLIL